MPPSREFKAPGYVLYFLLGGALSFLAGLGLVVVALHEGSSPWPAVAFFAAGIVSLIYAQIAEAIARTHWRVERLAHDLAGVIDEVQLQAERRLQAERTATRQQEEAIRRALAPAAAAEHTLAPR